MKLARLWPHVIGIFLGIGAFILLGVLGVPQSSIVQVSYHERLPWRSSAPNITLMTTTGDSVDLDGLRGTEVGLVFETPTCRYCRDLKKYLIESEIKESDCRLFFISLPTADSLADSIEYMEMQDRFHAQIPFVQDTQGRRFRAYKITGVPTVYRITEMGMIGDSAIGIHSSIKLSNSLAKSH